MKWQKQLAETSALSFSQLVASAISYRIMICGCVCWIYTYIHMYRYMYMYRVYIAHPHTSVCLRESESERTIQSKMNESYQKNVCAIPTVCADRGSIILFNACRRIRRCSTGTRFRNVSTTSIDNCGWNEIVNRNYKVVVVVIVHHYRTLT